MLAAMTLYGASCGSGPFTRSWFTSASGYLKGSLLLQVAIWGFISSIPKLGIGS